MIKKTFIFKIKMLYSEVICSCLNGLIHDSGFGHTKSKLVLIINMFVLLNVIETIRNMFS